MKIRLQPNHFIEEIRMFFEEGFRDRDAIDVTLGGGWTDDYAMLRFRPATGGIQQATDRKEPYYQC